MSQILVAGIGNIFKGDDAFGVEVVQRLAQSPLPDGVKVVDFGIRGIDLTYALLDGYDAAILVDGAARRLARYPSSRQTGIRPARSPPAIYFLSRTTLIQRRCCAWWKRSAAAVSASCSSPASRERSATKKRVRWGSVRASLLRLTRRSRPSSGLSRICCGSNGVSKSRAHSQTEKDDERMGDFLDHSSGADRSWNSDESA
jgi:hypothetical protein